MNTDMDIISSLPLNGIQNYTHDRQEQLEGDKLKLRNACNDFEAVLTSTILKEGLNNAKEMGKVCGDDEEEDNAGSKYTEMANEQMAYFIGKQGILGVGDFLYNSLKDRIALEETNNGQNAK